MSGRSTRKRDGMSLFPKNYLQSLQQQQPSTSSNQFSSLNPDVDLSDDDDRSMYSGISASSKRSKPSNNKKQKNPLSPSPPPLTIIGQDYNAVCRILTNVKTFDNDFAIKLAPSGIKVFPSTTENFKKLKIHLQTIRAKFFTHSLREEQTSKFVLHGLNDMLESELLTLLKEESLEPLKVKKMNIMKKKYSDHCAYIIYFPKMAKIKISKLREIRALNYIRVRWDFYSNRRQGPIQCSNCMSFGHGGNGCFLPSVCIRCGKNHKSQECPLLVDNETMEVRTRVPVKSLKCGLCGQNHTANFSQCEKRLEFIERQKRYKMKIQKRSARFSDPAPQLDNHNFPGFSPFQQNQTPKPAINQSPQYSDALRDKDLFNTTELMNIFTEMMTKMQSASSKLQQIQVLGEIVIKYCSR